MAGRWKTLIRFTPEDFPAAPGCYVITCNGPGGAREVLYVGQSTNLRARFTAHDLQTPGVNWDIGKSFVDGFTRTPWGEFKNVVVKYRPSLKFGDWAMVELRMIRRLRPLFNSCALAKRATPAGRSPRWLRLTRVR